jgi:PAS domain S-box-containing protein
MPTRDEELLIMRALAVTDPSPDAELDELVRYVARVCSAPCAVLGLLGRSRLWFKSRRGIEASEAPKFPLPDDLLVVEDAAVDARGPGNPLLAAVPGARFLAMAPLRDGPIELGVLAILDRKPRVLSIHQTDTMRFAASLAAGIVKLRRRAQLLESLLESSPDQFYAFDAAGRYIYVSERGARAMGLDKARMIGGTWQQAGGDPAYAEQFRSMFRLALTTGQLIEDARKISTPAGVVHHEYALSPLRGQRGEIEGAALTARDVTARVAADTERRAALETAQRAVRQRDDVLAVVSHDLRNMLNIFRLTAASLADQLPQKKAKKTGTARDLVTMLQAQADSMSRLVDDLMDVGRIDAGGLRIVRAGCDARMLADEALVNVQPLAKRKGISLDADLPPPGTLVHCDRHRIRQVFSNLLGNAIKFTTQGGVRLDVTVEERDVCFSVTDTGAGISPEHLPYLFERYWQGAEGERSGAGLGLYIARGIVEAHGGRIWAESTPGKGTRISFTLTRAP